MKLLYCIYYILLITFVSCNLKYTSVSKLFKILNISNVHPSNFYNFWKLENSKYLSDTFDLNNAEERFIDYIQSSAQGKCLKDIWYILKNLKSQWVIKSKLLYSQLLKVSCISE